jgi:hypothetical protein
VNDCKDLQKIFHDCLCLTFIEDEHHPAIEDMHYDNYNTKLMCLLFHNSTNLHDGIRKNVWFNCDKVQRMARRVCPCVKL